MNITSVSVAGCASAYLHYSSLPEATDLEEMIVQNIRGRLDFSVYITSTRLKLLRLANIGQIPVIASHTFATLTNIDTLEIENTHIDDIEEEFTYVNVSRFLVTNVTIGRVDRLNLSENATMLYIVNSEFQNITTSLNFANFQTIEIVDSKFVLQKPGLVSIQGEVVVVNNSVFWNASMNLVAAHLITVRGICADGKSTLRLSSNHIASTDNRLPNEIAYPTRDGHLAKPEFFTNRNNTVCKAGHCKCPKSNGQTTCRACVSVYVILGCLLAASLSKGFY